MGEHADRPAALLAESKRTAACCATPVVLRRIDTLAATASATDGPSRPLIGEARSAVERLVSDLMRRQQTEHRGMKQAARRLR